MSKVKLSKLNDQVYLQFLGDQMHFVRRNDGRRFTAEAFFFYQHSIGMYKTNSCRDANLRDGGSINAMADAVMYIGDK